MYTLKLEPHDAAIQIPLIDGIRLPLLMEYNAGRAAFLQLNNHDLLLNQRIDSANSRISNVEIDFNKRFNTHSDGVLRGAQQNRVEHEQLQSQIDGLRVRHDVLCTRLMEQGLRVAGEGAPKPVTINTAPPIKVDVEMGASCGGPIKLDNDGRIIGVDFAAPMADTTVFAQYYKPATFNWRAEAERLSGLIQDRIKERDEARRQLELRNGEMDLLESRLKSVVAEREEARRQRNEKQVTVQQLNSQLSDVTRNGEKLAAKIQELTVHNHDLKRATGGGLTHELECAREKLRNNEQTIKEMRDQLTAFASIPNIGSQAATLLGIAWPTNAVGYVGAVRHGISRLQAIRPVILAVNEVLGLRNDTSYDGQWLAEKLRERMVQLTSPAPQPVSEVKTVEPEQVKPRRGILRAAAKRKAPKRVMKRGQKVRTKRLK